MLKVKQRPWILHRQHILLCLRLFHLIQQLFISWLVAVYGFLLLLLQLIKALSSLYVGGCQIIIVLTRQLSEVLSTLSCLHLFVPVITIAEETLARLVRSKLLIEANILRLLKELLSPWMYHQVFIIIIAIRALISYHFHEVAIFEIKRVEYPPCLLWVVDGGSGVRTDLKTTIRMDLCIFSSQDVSSFWVHVSSIPHSFTLAGLDPEDPFTEHLRSSLVMRRHIWVREQLVVLLSYFLVVLLYEIVNQL